ncbi:metal-dependent hydrolase [Mycobacteroides abscessus subsp. abscessus]|nr:metal-dependent hydrolase [Mycobacteroides abscessus subsp. abscessus]
MLGEGEVRRMLLNDSDNTELIEKWHAELFGENGQLAGHLH